MIGRTGPLLDHGWDTCPTRALITLTLARTKTLALNLIPNLILHCCSLGAALIPPDAHIQALQGLIMASSSTPSSALTLLKLCRPTLARIAFMLFRNTHTRPIQALSELLMPL